MNIQERPVYLHVAAVVSSDVSYSRVVSDPAPGCPRDVPATAGKPYGFFRACKQILTRPRVNSPRPRAGDTLLAPVFHTGFRHGVSGAKEDPQPALIGLSSIIDVYRVSAAELTAPSLRAPIYMPDIDDGTAACFGSEKYFRQRRPLRASTAARPCNSRTARTVLLCKQSTGTVTRYGVFPTVPGSTAKSTAVLLRRHQTASCNGRIPERSSDTSVRYIAS